MDDLIKAARQLIKIADLVSYVPYEEFTPKLRLLRKRTLALYRAVELVQKQGQRPDLRR